MINIQKKSLLHVYRGFILGQNGRTTFSLNVVPANRFCSKPKADNPNDLKSNFEQIKSFDESIALRHMEMEKKMIVSRFDEKKFSAQFNNVFLNYTLSKEGQATELMNQLRLCVNSVQRLETLVGVLDKAAKYNIFLGKDFEIKLLERGLILINDPKYYEISSDGGDLVKSLTLVAGLKKIRHYPFYNEIVFLLNDQGQSFTLKNVLTIVETISYNKLTPHLKGGGEYLPKIVEILKGVKVQDIDLFSPLANLMCYFLKNRTLVPLYAEEKGIVLISQEIVKSIHNCLLGIMSSTLHDSLDIFTVCEIQNHLEIYSRLSTNEEILFIQKKFNNYFATFIQRHFSSKTYYDYDKVLRYVKKFLTSPPVALNPSVVRLINSTFASVKPQSLSEVIPFLYFFSKTIQGYKIPFESHKTIEENLEKEKNIMILSKLMEIYASTQYSNDQQILALEKRIVLLSRLSANPATPLMILFQSLTNIQRGEISTIQYIADYFKYPGVLNRIEFFDLIVKFIPSLAVKTKELFKFTTNMGFQSSSIIMEESNQVNPELQKSLEELWDKVEAIVIAKIDEIYFDKYPTLLLHFLYANLMKNKYRRIFQVLNKRVVQHLYKYSAKQVSEVIYAYARIHEKNTDLFYKSIPIITKAIADFNEIEIVNIYWGYANARIFDEDLCSLLEARITKDHSKISLEGTIQFLHSLGIYGRIVQPKSEIDQFIRTKLQNVESLKMTTQQQFALAYAFLLFPNRSAYSSIWENLINLILQNQTNFTSSPVYMNYLYQIYIHLRYSEQAILLPCMQQLLQVLIKHREALIRFFKVNKRYYSSDFEKRVVKVIEKRISPSSQLEKNFVVQIKHDIPLIFYDDLRELEGNSNFPESELVIPYTFDFRRGALCFEVNGPQHYLTDTNKGERLDGINMLKKNFVQQMGFKYIEIKNTSFTPEIQSDEELFSQKIIEDIRKQMEK